MIPCVILGDSIAVGIGQNRPDCATTAQVGITSERFAQDMMVQQVAGTAIISLGVNDDLTVPTADNLRSVRRRVTAQRVFWIMPNIKEYARAAVREVAAEYGDRTLDLRQYRAMIAPDQVHPTGSGYQIIAARLRDEDILRLDGRGDGRGDGRAEVAEAPAGTWGGSVPGGAGAWSAPRGWTRVWPPAQTGGNQVALRHARARAEARAEARGDGRSAEGRSPGGKGQQVAQAIPVPPTPPVHAAALTPFAPHHATVYRTFKEWRLAHPLSD